MFCNPPLNEKIILIDILNRMCELRQPVNCRYEGGRIEAGFQKCYIGGITTNIGKSKRVLVPSETIGMCFQNPILVESPPI